MVACIANCRYSYLSSVRSLPRDSLRGGWEETVFCRAHGATLGTLSISCVLSVPTISSSVLFSCVMIEQLFRNFPQYNGSQGYEAVDNGHVPLYGWNAFWNSSAYGDVQWCCDTTSWRSSFVSRLIALPKSKTQKKKYLHDSVLADEFTTANKLNTIAHSGKICARALVEDSVTRRCR